jgi:hypothetical protein
MTRKQQILRMIGNLPDDVSYDRVMYHLTVMKKIEIGTEQVERGQVVEHEEVFQRLLGDEKKKTRLVKAGRGRSPRNKTIHRAASAARST